MRFCGLQVLILAAVGFQIQLSITIESWQKVDERTGALVEDEDIIDGGDTPGGGGSEPGDNEGWVVELWKVKSLTRRSVIKSQNHVKVLTHFR